MKNNNGGCMSKREPRLIDLTKYRDLDIGTFRIASVTGDDIVRAAERCTPVDGGQIDGNLFGILLRQQLIAGAIAEVDGTPVKGSCQESIRWNSRTREFVGKAFDYVNGTTDKERDSFDKALAAGDLAPEATPGSSTPISSENG